MHTIIEFQYNDSSAEKSDAVLRANTSIISGHALTICERDQYGEVFWGVKLTKRERAAGWDLDYVFNGFAPDWRRIFHRQPSCEELTIYRVREFANTNPEHHDDY